MGYFANYERQVIAITITVSEVHPVFYSIEIPGLGYSNNGVIAANENEVVIDLPSSAVVSSINDQNKGVYIMTNSSTTTVFGQTVWYGTSDTFLALPRSNLDCSEECVYYGISLARSITEQQSDRHQSSILVVGIDNSTLMKLTVVQPVKIRVGNTTYGLISGIQYTFTINRLQTVLIRSPEDLTGTKIVTDKPVSVFSGHQCAQMAQNDGPCDYIIEQIPPTIVWGEVFYIATLTNKRTFTIKVLSANNYTNVEINCNKRFSYTLNAGDFITR